MKISITRQGIAAPGALANIFSQNQKENAVETRAENTLAAAGCLMMLAGCSGIKPGRPAGEMTFFVTSVGSGKGADLGGIGGADQHCQTLAKIAGSDQHKWHAYLSTQGSALSDPAFLNARDRIGSGPWYNAKGVLIAKNVEDLHSSAAQITKETALDEKGQAINGRTENPNMHDILTGSRPDGTAFPGAPFADLTCGNWSKSGTDGSAMLGHHDRAGPIGASWASSWNSSHPTRGCNLEGLRSTGGNGLFYCFATD